jgi:hemoglobin-like flavoprotein
VSHEGVVLRDAIEEVLAQEVDFALRFYERLFERYPELRPMFHRSSPDAQQRMFTQKLVYLIDFYDDSQRLEQAVREVASTHKSYNVTAEMYGWVGGVLLEVLAEALGPRWDSETASAFEACWAKVSDLVLQHTPA